MLTQQPPLQRFSVRVFFLALRLEPTLPLHQPLQPAQRAGELRVVPPRAGRGRLSQLGERAVRFPALGPELHDAVGRQSEIVGRRGSIAQEEAKQRLAPARHPRAARCHQVLASEEERRRPEIDLAALRPAERRYPAHARALHEAEADDHADETLVQTLDLDLVAAAQQLLRCRHACVGKCHGADGGEASGVFGQAIKESEVNLNKELRGEN